MLSEILKKNMELNERIEDLNTSTTFDKKNLYEKIAIICLLVEDSKTKNDEDTYLKDKETCFICRSKFDEDLGIHVSRIGYDESKEPIYLLESRFEAEDEIMYETDIATFKELYNKLCDLASQPFSSMDNQ
jgi:hypothetical protein